MVKILVHFFSFFIWGAKYLQHKLDIFTCTERIQHKVAVPLPCQVSKDFFDDLHAEFAVLNHVVSKTKRLIAIHESKLFISFLVLVFQAVFLFLSGPVFLLLLLQRFLGAQLAQLLLEYLHDIDSLEAISLHKVDGQLGLARADGPCDTHYHSQQM